MQKRKRLKGVLRQCAGDASGMHSFPVHVALRDVHAAIACHGQSVICNQRQWPKALDPFLPFQSKPKHSPFKEVRKERERKRERLRDCAYRCRVVLAERPSAFSRGVDVPCLTASTASARPEFWAAKSYSIQKSQRSWVP